MPVSLVQPLGPESKSLCATKRWFFPAVTSTVSFTKLSSVTPFVMATRPPPSSEPMREALEDQVSAPLDVLRAHEVWEVAPRDILGDGETHQLLGVQGGGRVRSG